MAVDVEENVIPKQYLSCIKNCNDFFIFLVMCLYLFNVWIYITKLGVLWIYAKMISQFTFAHAVCKSLQMKCVAQGEWISVDDNSVGWLWVYVWVCVFVFLAH